MSRVCALAFLCLGVNGEALDTANNGGHPISKVISMLKNLKEKSVNGGHEEAASYQEFHRWCSESVVSLTDAIADEKAQIAELDDLLSGKTAKRETLRRELVELDDQRADMAKSEANATAQREDEAQAYSKRGKALAGTIEAMEAAIHVLNSAEQSTEPVRLAQVSVRKALALISFDTSVTGAELNELQAFAEPKKEAEDAVTTRPKQLAQGGLSTHVDEYDFKSEKVIELLKKLRLRFQDDHRAAIKGEADSQNSFALERLARSNAIKAAQASQQKKYELFKKVEGTIADTTASLKNENDDLEADSKTLTDTQNQCATKKGEWENRNEVRRAEIAAMDAAIEILAKATGVRTEAPSNPIPPASPVDFLQLDYSSRSPRMAVVALLHKAAQKTNSKALERLAVEIKAHLSDPFDQVSNMIQKMTFRLMDQQRQEDEHKQWCDQEVSKTSTMMDDKSDKMKLLQAEIAREKSATIRLSEEIESSYHTIEGINKFTQDATEIRQTGKKENRLAIKDSDAAQQALEDAIAVLRSFYMDSGKIPKEPWEFLQEPGIHPSDPVHLPKKPDLWGSTYTGVADPMAQPTGIISVLEGVMSEFSKMSADTKAQEAVDQSEYERSMADSKIEKTRRTTEVEMKSNEKKRRADKMQLLHREDKGVANEYTASHKYSEDLEKACLGGATHESHETRKAARAEEIEALAKAQVVLGDASKEHKAKGSSLFLEVKRHTQLAP